MALDLDPGEQRVRLVYRKDNENLGVLDFDIISKRLEIKGLDDIDIISDADISIQAPRIALLGDVEVNGEIKQWGGKKLTFMDNDMEPYGTQTRNYWPYDTPIAPYQLGSGGNYVEPREYK